VAGARIHARVRGGIEATTVHIVKVIPRESARDL
jgi:hypothetical protein